jgi:hypothetical protein
MSLLLPERTHELIVQRLDKVGHRRAVAGLDEGFDRHAGASLTASPSRSISSAVIEMRTM